MSRRKIKRRKGDMERRRKEEKLKAIGNWRREEVEERLKKMEMERRR